MIKPPNFEVIEISFRGFAHGFSTSMVVYTFMALNSCKWDYRDM